VSRFQVSHGMLLNVLSRRGDGCAAMRQIIRDSHEPDAAKKATGSAPGSCSARWSPAADRRDRPEDEEGARVRVNVELQDDFSMDQALSLYLLETIPLLDPESPDLRARPAHAGGVDPREPGGHPAPRSSTSSRARRWRR
jgi:hypothetical protein